ncbi:FxsA family protein [Mycolicibacterium komossense]|uniref:Membrane protein FxsA n=1 Tax=Mycolicibacterium komossense TaxID=1779 RepID=A0ABT3C720_9MYCO|nr:FxsA family protein [Mycolicibacterium komossense]MCV7225244.1 membrane protein FxsA [Mycolicibacterium komossense]
MVMRLFLVYVLVELAVVIALASTIGIGWTLLAVLGVSVLGMVLASSQLRRQLAKLRRGVGNPQGAVTDSALVAIGTLLVFVPGLVSTVVGSLMLLPPTRAAVRPLATALAARTFAKQMSFVNLGGVNPDGVNLTGPARGAYIDGEVLDVQDSDSADTRGGAARPDPVLPVVIQRKPE